MLSLITPSPYAPMNCTSKTAAGGSTISVSSSVSSKLKNVGDVELDSKTALQHWIQGKGGGLPIYTDLKKEGLDHDPTFHVQVKLDNGLTANGMAKSKRYAQQKAAEKLLLEIKKINE